MKTFILYIYSYVSVLIISLLWKSWLHLCMEESTFHEMVISLSQRFSSMLCLYLFFALFLLF